MTTSRTGETASYLLGRIAALASRPLILLAANHLAGNDTAALIAVAFLVVTLASAASAFDSHRGFYQARFTLGRRQPVRAPYRDYVAALVLQVGVVALPLAGFVLWRHHQPGLALAVLAYFASERLADESQRYLMFQGRRGAWGARILAKACAQLALTVLACAWAPTPLAAALSVCGLALGNLLGYASLLKMRHLPRHLGSVLGAWRHCRSQFPFWMLSLATTVIAYMDRIVVMVFQQSDIAVFTLLVSCLSVVQNAMDYFFVSLRRKEFLQSRIVLRDLVRDRKLYGIVGGSTLFGAALCWAMVFLYKGQSVSPWWLVPVVLASQITLSLTMVVREMLYWKSDVRWLIRFDIGFIAVALLVILGLRQAGSGYAVVLAGLSLLFAVRLLLMGRNAGAPVSHSNTPCS